MSEPSLMSLETAKGGSELKCLLPKIGFRFKYNDQSVSCILYNAVRSFVIPIRLESRLLFLVYGVKFCRNADRNIITKCGFKSLFETRLWTARYSYSYKYQVEHNFTLVGKCSAIVLCCRHAVISCVVGSE